MTFWNRHYRSQNCCNGHCVKGKIANRCYIHACTKDWLHKSRTKGKRLTKVCTWDILKEGRWRRASLEWAQSCSDPCCSWHQYTEYNQLRIWRNQFRWTLWSTSVLRRAWNILCSAKGWITAAILVNQFG